MYLEVEYLLTSLSELLVIYHKDVYFGLGDKKALSTISSQIV